MNMTEEDDESAKLDWKDYIAIAIAAIQTILLPLVILIAVMIIFAIILNA
jgi:hypothetical protein